VLKNTLLENEEEKHQKILNDFQKELDKHKELINTKIEKQ